MAEVIAELVGRLSFEVDDDGLKKFNEGMGDAEEGADKATVKGVAFGTLLGNLATKALEAGTAVVKFAANLAIDTVEGFIDSGAELDKWSKKVGVSAQELQRLEFAGKLVGAEVDNTREAVKTFRENLGELDRIGTGPARDALGTLGIELEEIQNLGATEQLQLFSEALNELPDDAQRLSVAIEAMGEDGAALLPLFQQGAEGIAEMSARADELGIVLDEGAIQSAVEAKAAIGEMSATFRGTANQLVAEFTPAITDMVRTVQDWILQNRELIETKVREFVEGAVPAIQGFADVVVEVVDVGGDLITWIGDLESGLIVAETAAIAFAAVMGGLPGLIVAISSEIVKLILDLRGFQAEIDRIEGENRERGQDIVDTGLQAIQTLNEAKKAGTLGQLSEQEFGRLTEQATGTLVQEAVSEQDISETIGRFETSRNVQRLVTDAAQNIDTSIAASKAESDRKVRGKRRGKFRRKELAAAAGGGGGGGIDTTRAEELFGPELQTLAQAAGVGDQAIVAALEAASKALEGGAAAPVARQAAVGKLERLGGVKLGGSADAALFQTLTQIGGEEAARSAASGARFVRIDQSVSIDVGGVDLVLPEGAGQALTAEGFAGDLGTAIRRQLVEQVFLPVIDRHGRPAAEQ